MKRTHWLSLVLACSLASALLSAHVRAQEETAPQKPPAVEPGPWEYKVFPMDYREYREKDDWKEHLERAGGNEFKADVLFKTHVLNWLATNEGWELVQVVQQTKPDVTLYYLKRPRAGTQPRR